METLQTPLNEAQLELLKLFSLVKSEEERIGIKTISGQYYANKAIAEANRLWDERGYTRQTMNDWMNEPA